MAPPRDQHLPNHYALHAYVLPGNVMRLEPFGRVTFDHVYRNRPEGARYAVVGDYNVALHVERYLAWDLFETLKQTADDKLVAPEPRLVHIDLDAAIMATVLLYNTEPKRTL